MSFKLLNKVALVTGASRGIGKGIAKQLAQNGAKVYITGRTLKSNEKRQSLEDTQSEITSKGGECIAVRCDHEIDGDVENLFEQIKSEQNGQLDILVNSAFKGANEIFENSELKFWETDPVRTWDDANNVGLRNNYMCTVYASRMMVPRKQGLIVNLTSLGGLQYAFNAAYGIGKSAVDRMTADCGIELRRSNVASIGLLLGGVRTELSEEIIKKMGDKAVLKLDPNSLMLNEIKLKNVIDDSETPEFAGKVIAEMGADPNLMKYTSKIVIAAEYAQAHKITDIDGRKIPSHRQINSAVKMILPRNLHPIANLIPDAIKLPQFAFDLMGSKF